MTVKRVDIGENTYIVGESVDKIIYHEAQFPSDFHYVDVYFKNGNKFRYFDNIKLVGWDNEPNADAIERFMKMARGESV